jgi:hypothetical protein
MSEDSDHLPELLVSQDIRSCIETVHPMVPIRRGLHRKDVARGIGEMYGCCNPWIAQAKRTRRRSPESWVGFGAFDIKIALLIEGQSAWATGIRGTQLLQRGVPAGGARVVAVEGTGEIPGHDGGQTETERSKPALPGARLQAGRTVAKAARVITKDFSRPLL